MTAEGRFQAAAAELMAAHVAVVAGWQADLRAMIGLVRAMATPEPRARRRLLRQLVDRRLISQRDAAHLAMTWRRRR